jgi:deoxycytidine triphosphate deaminase
MLLKSDRIAEKLENAAKSIDPLVITPRPDLAGLRKSGSASIDLRLGTWLVTLRQSRSALLDVSNAFKKQVGENRLTKRYYVPFGQGFILHPHILSWASPWSGCAFLAISPDML